MERKGGLKTNTYTKEMAWMTHWNAFLILVEESVCPDRILLKIPVFVILPQLIEAPQTFKLDLATINMDVV